MVLDVRQRWSSAVGLALLCKALQTLVFISVDGAYDMGCPELMIEHAFKYLNCTQANGIRASLQQSS